MKVFRPLLAIVLSMSFGSLVVLLGFEAVVRVFFLRVPTAKRTLDRPSVYFVPEASRSVRDNNYTETKPENTFRIGVIGDSFAFGFNNLYDDAFPKRLERILNLNLNQRKVEVINFGTPGLSSKQEVPWVETAIEKYGVDVLLLDVTLNDAELMPYQSPRGSLSERMNGGMLRGGIYDSWKGLAFVMTRLENWKTHREYVEYFQGLYTDPKGLSEFENALQQIGSRCEKANVKLLAVIFPLFAKPLDETYPFRNLHEKIAHILQEKNISSLDLLPSYQGMNNERLQAIPGVDPHPSEIAHRIAAEVLLAKLAELHYLPDEVVPHIQLKRRDLKQWMPKGKP